MRSYLMQFFFFTTELSETLEEIQRLKPKHAMLVGMSHDFDYHEMNAKFKEMKDISVECPFDGQVVELPSLARLKTQPPVL